MVTRRLRASTTQPLPLRGTVLGSPPTPGRVGPSVCDADLLRLSRRREHLRYRRPVRSDYCWYGGPTGNWTAVSGVGDQAYYCDDGPYDADIVALKNCVAKVQIEWNSDSSPDFTPPSESDMASAANAALARQPTGAASLPDCAASASRRGRAVAPRWRGGHATASRRRPHRARRHSRRAPGPQRERPREQRGDQDIWPPPTLAARSQRASDNRNHPRAAVLLVEPQVLLPPRACSRFDWWGPESHSASRPRRASTGSAPRRSASM